MELSDEELDRLLKGTPILQALRKHRTAEAGLNYRAKPRGAWQLPTVLPRLALGALALLVLVPTAYWGVTRGWSRGAGTAPTVPLGHEFTARGDLNKQPRIKISCFSPSGAPGRCAPGSTMAFTVTPAGFSSLAAFAQAPDGSIIWYFPNETQPSGLSLSALPPSGVLPRVVSIDDSYAPGTYVIHAIFSNGPLRKDQARQAVSAAAPSRKTVVLKEEISVETP